MTEFVQFVEYETERMDEMRALAEEFREKRRPESGGPTRLTVCQDRDRPNRYVTVIEFPSYEEAMANSNNPATHEFAMRMAELCTSEPRFVNLDVLEREDF